MQKIQVTLKNGEKVIGDRFDISDFKKIKSILKRCFELNKDLNSLGGRKLNIPDVVSEGIYCYLFNATRTNGTAYSYDAVDIQTGEGIQIKSASIDKDCTSFGPTSEWDKLIFEDFAPNGTNDGTIAFYHVPSEYIYSSILNHNKNETFIDQQKQGRRPRLSLKEIINHHNIKPLKVINIME